MIQHRMQAALLAAVALIGQAPLSAKQAAPPAPVASLAIAKERAAAAKQPILVMVLNDAEPACQRMLDKVYSDPDVQAALRGFVLLISSPDTHAHEAQPRDGEVIESCVKYPGVRCSEHQAVERELKPRIADPAGNVIVPQHVVLRADGELLQKRPYALKKQGFLEFLAAVRALNDAPEAVAGRSPTIEKLSRSLLEAKEGREREQAARALAGEASPEREQAFLEALEQMRNGEERGEAIRALGRIDHQAWAPTIAAFLDEKDRHVRNCAVVTLDEMKATAVIDDLLELRAGEKDPELRKDLVRALGPCGAGSPEAKRIVLEELAGSKEALRAAAGLAAGALLKGAPDVAAALEARFKKEKSESVRMAVVWGIGESEDAAQAPLLERLVAKEKADDVVKLAAVARARLEGKTIEAAGKALGKGGAKELRRLLGVMFDDDKIPRTLVRDIDRRISGKQ